MPTKELYVLFRPEDQVLLWACDTYEEAIKYVKKFPYNHDIQIEPVDVGDAEDLDF